MLTLKRGSDSAIVIVHEIYGINQHIIDVCRMYHSLGHDVYCPNLLAVAEPFSYSQQDEAYYYFINNVGFEISHQIDQLLKQIRPHYKKIILVGFSIGATIAWISSKNGLCDGIVGFYGSRIRDYLSIIPRCPSLLIFASKEVSFSFDDIINMLTITPYVTTKVLIGNHGFCDPFSVNYDLRSANIAEKLTLKFISELVIT